MRTSTSPDKINTERLYELLAANYRLWPKLSQIQRYNLLVLAIDRLNFCGRFTFGERLTNAGEKVWIYLEEVTE